MPRHRELRGTAWFNDARRGRPDLASEQSAIETALRLTAITLLLRPMGPWFVLPLVLAGAALVLISPRVLYTPAVWLGVAAAIGLRIADDWPLADNHIYLFAYWALAIALALRSLDVSDTLAFTSRWLVGLAFVFAVCWKALLSPDFLDGRFFRVTLLTDPRFGEAAMLIGGLSPTAAGADRQALTPLPQGAELLTPPTVVEPPRLARDCGGVDVGEPGSRSVGGHPDAAAATAPDLCLQARGVVDVLRGHLRLRSRRRVWMAPAGDGHRANRRPAGLAAAWLRCGILVVLFYSEVPWTSLLLRVLR